MKYLFFMILSFYSLWGYAWPDDATLESSPPPKTKNSCPVTMVYSGGDSVITPANQGTETFILRVDKDTPLHVPLHLELLFFCVGGVKHARPGPHAHTLFTWAFQATPSHYCGATPGSLSDVVILNPGERCCAVASVGGYSGFTRRSIEFPFTSSIQNSQYNYSSLSSSTRWSANPGVTSRDTNLNIGMWLWLTDVSQVLRKPFIDVLITRRK